MHPLFSSKLDEFKDCDIPLGRKILESAIHGGQKVVADKDEKGLEFKGGKKARRGEIT